MIERFAEYNQRSFLAQSGNTYTYSELVGTIHRYHALFKQKGIQAGDVVTLEADYSMTAIATLFSLFRLKTITTPITTISSAELKFRRTESNAKWNIDVTSDNTFPKIIRQETVGVTHEIIEKLRKQDRSGLILFSSGSTGKPKAMVHDVNRLLSTFVKKSSRQRRILIFLLFDHIGGLNTLFNALASGSLIVVPSSRDASAVGEAIQTYKVNLLPASPTFLNLLLMNHTHKKFDLSSLRFVTYGTEPMPESLLIRLKEALPHTSFIQTFGTSETGISQTFSRSSQSTQIKISDPNTEFKIIDGELWLRSKTQILGYLNHDQSRFTEDGWFKTGDRVEKAPDGFLRIIGRREDLINVGGEKVSPLEVESILMELPEIADCRVYGEPNAITGQNVVAEIVLKQGMDYDFQKLKRLIKQHCRRVLSPYKVPARILFNSKITISSRYKK